MNTVRTIFRPSLSALLMVAFCAGPAGCGKDANVGSDLVGYWLWIQQVDSNSVVQEITEDDLVVKVGSSGWTGCPDGIICTHYGIMKLRFDSDGTMWYIYNVNTSSDYQHPGSCSVTGSLVSYTFNEMFSCAHPGDSTQEDSSGYFPYKIVDGNLWVGVNSFNGWSPFYLTPPADSQKWIVFRRITEEEYNTKYMIRVCMASDPSQCNAGCFPEQYGNYGP